MPKSLVRKHTEWVVSKDGQEFAVEFEPVEDFGRDPVIEVLEDGRVVVGYLSRDIDPTNPLDDCDGSGHVYSCHRHASREQHANYREAMGLDSDWHSIEGFVRSHMTVVLDCYDHSGQVWAIQGSLQAMRFPDQQ